MRTFADFFTSLKDELAARYRSPIWGVLFISLTAFHWKIFVYFFTESPNSTEAIAFVEGNITIRSILNSIVFSMCYVIAFPWFELAVARLSSFGKRARNDFHTQEREKEIGRRKIIAQRQAQLIELELKNKTDQSILADIELVKSYQNILAGETFVRWMRDLQNGAVHNSLNHSISNYLNKVDSIEGKFINPEIEFAHINFVNSISTLASALSDGNGDARRPELMKFSQSALDAHQEYRKKVRDLLGI